MSIKEFAERLNSREYRNELTKEDICKAKEKGFVIVYGASDDLMEIRGAIEDEWDCFNGGIVRINKKGLTDDENSKYIEACWCTGVFDGEKATWSYNTNINHEKFKIYEDGELYCVGIVFDIKDIKQKSNADILLDKLKDVAFERYGADGMGGELVVNYDDIVEIIRNNEV